MPWGCVKCPVHHTHIRRPTRGASAGACERRRHQLPQHTAALTVLGLTAHASCPCDWHAERLGERGVCVRVCVYERRQRSAQHRV